MSAIEQKLSPAQKLILRAIKEEPLTRSDLEGLIKIQYRSVNRCLRALHDLELIHIGSWRVLQRVKQGAMYVPCYHYGKGRDKPMPAAQTKTMRQRTYRARKASLSHLVQRVAFAVVRPTFAGALA